MDYTNYAEKMLNRCDHSDQLSIAMEELAEMIQAISKWNRYGNDDAKKMVIEEMVDCTFMIEQVKQIVGVTDLEFQEKKLELFDKLKNKWGI